MDHDMLEAGEGISLLSLIIGGISIVLTYLALITLSFAYIYYIFTHYKIAKTKKQECY